MTEGESVCRQVDDNMSDIIDGVAPAALFDHVAGCDRCRDARFETEQVLLRVASTSDDYRFPLAIVLTLSALFAVGAARALVTHLGWIRSGLEMLCVGALAAAVAYSIGALASALT